MPRYPAGITPDTSLKDLPVSDFVMRRLEAGFSTVGELTALTEPQMFRWLVNGPLQFYRRRAPIRGVAMIIILRQVLDASGLAFAGERTTPISDLIKTLGHS